MFGLHKNRGISLMFAGARLRAGSVAEFDAALNPLTAVSAQRLAELGSLDDEALNYDEQNLGRLIAQLSNNLNTDAEVAESAKRIQALGGVHLPWSEALLLASQWQDHQRPFRQSLLKAYVRFLTNEQACLQTLRSNRRRQPAEQEPAAGPAARLCQRLIFTPHALGLERCDGSELALARLGKGNVAEISFQPGQSATLMLSRHLFLIVCGAPWLLIDSHGEDMQLAPGHNLVGRSNDCDVVVNERYFAVSRRHAILKTEASNILKITDLSSLGTFIPQADRDNRFH